MTFRVRSGNADGSPQAYAYRFVSPGSGEAAFPVPGHLTAPAAWTEVVAGPFVNTGLRRVVSG